MIRLEVKNVSSVLSRLRKSVQDNLDAQFQDRTKRIFQRLVEVTPQWSGNLAANWRITFDPATFSTVSPLKREDWKQGPWAVMGDPLAVMNAVASAKTVQFGWNDVVYFTNGTPLSFSDTLVSGDGSVAKVRPENLIDGRVAMISYILSTYKSGVPF